MPQALAHSHFLPGFAGEVSASCADGGVMSFITDAHDPSARYAGQAFWRFAPKAPRPIADSAMGRND